MFMRDFRTIFFGNLVKIIQFCAPENNKFLSILAIRRVKVSTEVKLLDNGLLYHKNKNVFMCYKIALL